ncbi:MAG: phosphopyruvate hydratase [Acidobacteria bacterium]|nr:phosphopyruvate hydratase [Acidobacteriota bacterium]
MSKICQIRAREILDSRGNPTVEVDVVLSDGSLGRAAVPSGASTGDREALELRDNDPVRYAGKGVTKAVAHVSGEMASALRGQEAGSQQVIDRTLIDLDGTPNKARLGANAILGVSMATARASAASARLPLYRYLVARDTYSLPIPTVNVINGGAHAVNALDFQEFMLVPVGAPTMAEAVRWSAETFHALKTLLREAGHVTGVGDEGGYAPNLTTAEEALDMLIRAIEHAGYRPGPDISLSMDPAASELFHHGQYEFAKAGQPSRSTADMIALFERLVGRYPLVFIEDGLSEHDWDGWKALTDRLSARALLVGDDIFVTNPVVIRDAVARGIGNATLIKLNQIGTVTDATDAAYIKTGSMARSEGVAKYNQLMRIESELGAQALFGGAARAKVARS